MGEALMFRAGSEGSGKYELVTEIITENTIYTVPSDAKNNEFDVRIFGGGGGGIRLSDVSSKNNIYHVRSAGGGGGWMNNSILILNPGEKINISIGTGGVGSLGGDATTSNGGTTSFGTYLSAAGGERAYIVGGQTSYPWECHGGNGGSGGGASVGGFSINGYGDYYTSQIANSVYAGTGYQFGGGAAFGSYNTIGGNGGPWGGGGAIHKSSYGPSVSVGIGGIYGGNGGRYGCNNTTNINSENGTNTIGDMNIDIDCRGYGSGGSNHGGGGGYGGNGGDMCGGGGGYGADGGSQYGGGGGGYGKFGYGGSGGGGQGWAGGGGAYGPGGGPQQLPKYGGGGGGYYFKMDLIRENPSEFNRKILNGADGICIIQYYKKK